MPNLSECSYFEIRTRLYKIPEFAALWCGIPEEEVDAILNMADSLDDTSLGSQILSQGDYPCLQIKCRYICNAIQEGALVTFNEKGRLQPLETEEHTAWARKHLRGDKALEWIMSTDMAESDMPKFLVSNEKNQIAEWEPASRDQFCPLAKLAKGEDDYGECPLYPDGKAQWRKGFVYGTGIADKLCGTLDYAGWVESLCIRVNEAMENSDNPSAIQNLIMSGKIGIYIEATPGVITSKMLWPQEGWFPDVKDWDNHCGSIDSYWPFNQISRDFYSCTDRLWVNRHELKAMLAREEERVNQQGKVKEKPALDGADCNPRSRNNLYRYIIGLARYGNIDLSEKGLASSIEAYTDEEGCRLADSTASEITKAIIEFQRQNKP